jgi:hypothetical protein
MTLDNRCHCYLFHEKTKELKNGGLRTLYSTSKKEKRHSLNESEELGIRDKNKGQ